MLIGFKPDYIEIGEEEDKKGVSNVIVGIYNKTLSKNEKYKAFWSRISYIDKLIYKMNRKGIWKCIFLEEIEAELLN